MLAVVEVKKRVQQGRGIGGGMEVSEYVAVCRRIFCRNILMQSIATIYSEP